MACILLSVLAVSVHDSQANRNMDMARDRISLIFELSAIILSFQMVLSFVSAAVVWAILAGISGLDPSSAMIALMYLKMSTQSSLSLLTLMSVLMLLVLLVISLVFSALIGYRSIVKAVNQVSEPLFPSCQAVNVVGKTQVRNSSAANADCPFMVIQCVGHNSFQEEVQEGGGDHTALSYSDCGSEPVPYVHL